MPSIVIVDDEAIFRKGLRAMIASLDPEWTVVGDARDGYEALDMLQFLRPDVMLTDIRMPRMDGIQLQKIARERFPELVCVVVSGYEDFTYVQQSMRYGAKDYLMKPIERDELRGLLNRLKSERREPLLARPAAPEPGEERRFRDRAIERLAAALAKGVVTAEDVAELADAGCALDEPWFACMAIKLDKESVGTERYRQADPSLFQLYIRQFVQELLDRREKGVGLIASDTEVVAVVNMPARDESRRRLRELAESIRLQIKSLSNITVTVGVGTLAEGAESISRSYREAEIALLHRLVVGGDKVLTYEETTRSRSEGAQTEPSRWSWDGVEQAVREGRAEAAEAKVARAVAELCRQAPQPEIVHQQICKLLIECYERSGEWGVTKAWLGDKDIRSLLFDVCSISSSDEMVDLCKGLFGKLARSVAQSGANGRQDPVAKALRYLEAHYDQQLTLKDVADAVYLNPAYFSTLFKQRTGTTFVERLTEIRVEAAKKRLASTREKVAEVAERTGFANVRHFNRVFKNETGLSPKDYRESIRGSEDDGPTGP